MSAADITADAVWQHIRAGVRDVHELSRKFGVLSASPTLRTVLDEIGVTVTADGWLVGDGIYEQPTLDQEGTAHA